MIEKDEDGIKADVYKYLFRNKIKRAESFSHSDNDKKDIAHFTKVKMLKIMIILYVLFCNTRVTGRVPIHIWESMIDLLKYHIFFN